MGTYLKLQTYNKTDNFLTALNKEWSNRADDLLLPNDIANNSTSKIGPIIHFFTKQDLTSWGKEILQDPTSRKLHSLTANSTVKQTIAKLQITYKDWAQIGNCEIKLSGTHYCYHILSRILVFLRLHKKDIRIHGWNDLCEYIDYQEMIDVTYYCSICKNLAKKAGFKLPYSVSWDKIYPKLNKIRENQTI